MEYAIPIPISNPNPIPSSNNEEYNFLKMMQQNDATYMQQQLILLVFFLYKFAEFTHDSRTHHFYGYSVETLGLFLE